MSKQLAKAVTFFTFLLYIITSVAVERQKCLAFDYQFDNISNGNTLRLLILRNLADVYF